MLRTGLRRIDGEVFYIEKLHKGVYTLTKVNRIYCRRKSQYQLIEIFDSEGYGVSLYLDGTTQISSADEFIYHESFVHPVMLSHPNPREVLIIGGGDGGVLREVLKHSCVERVDMVEIDAEVIESVRKFFGPSFSKVFEDPKARIVIDDGASFLRSSTKKYDVIFADVTDEIGPAATFYKMEIFRAMKERLKEEGIVCLQSLGIVEHVGAQSRLKRALKDLFKNVGVYVVYVPSFTGLWSFTYASDSCNPAAMSEEELRKRISKRGLDLKFYNPEVHDLLFKSAYYIKVLEEVFW